MEFARLQLLVPSTFAPVPTSGTNRTLQSGNFNSLGFVLLYRENETRTKTVNFSKYLLQSL